MAVAWLPYAGSAFLKPSGNKNHLFIVVDTPMKFEGYGPHDCVVIVSVTTLRNIPSDDLACLLNAGEHPFVRHPSYVAYVQAEVVTVPHLQGLLSTGVCSIQPDLSAEVLARVRAGLHLSKRISREFKKLLAHLNTFPSG
jgi:hypothetical protein